MPLIRIRGNRNIANALMIPTRAHSADYFLRSTMSNIRTIHTLQLPTYTRPSELDTGIFPTTSRFHESPFEAIQLGSTRTQMPQFLSLAEEQKYRKEHLILCFRALHRAGLAEGVAGELNHPSALSTVALCLKLMSRTLLSTGSYRAGYILGQPTRAIFRTAPR